MTTYGTIPTSTAASSTSDYLSLAKHRIRTGFSTRRPWKLMFRLHSLRLPGGFSDAVSRVFTNAAFFRANYAIVVLFVLFLSLLWHPISLIVFIAMTAAWLFLYFLRDEPVAVFGRAIDDRVMLVVLFVLTLVFLFLTGATENILVALLIGVVVVLAHAVVRKTDDLESDEEEGGGGLIAGDGASSSPT